MKDDCWESKAKTALLSWYNALHNGLSSLLPHGWNEISHSDPCAVACFVYFSDPPFSVSVLRPLIMYRAWTKSHFAKHSHVPKKPMFIINVSDFIFSLLSSFCYRIQTIDHTERFNYIPYKCWLRWTVLFACCRIFLLNHIRWFNFVLTILLCLKCLIVWFFSWGDFLNIHCT